MSVDYSPVTLLTVRDLRTVPGYSKSDIGPALQTAYNDAFAAGSSGQAILLPPGLHVLVTPAAPIALSEAVHVALVGIPGQSILSLNTTTGYDALKIAHASSTGAGSRLSFRDLIFTTPDPANTLACNRGINIDNNAGGVTEISNVTVVGVSSFNGLIRLEDGQVEIDKLKFQGCSAGHDAGLLQLWQTYGGRVRDVSGTAACKFRGVTITGFGTPSLVEWQPPQTGYGPSLINGRLVVDGLYCEGQVSYAVMAGYPQITGRQANTYYEVGRYATNDGGKLYTVDVPGTTGAGAGPTGTSTTITDGDVVWHYLAAAYRGGGVSIKNAQITTPNAASTGSFGVEAGIFIKNVDDVLIEDSRVSCNGATQQYAVELQNVGKARGNRIWTDPTQLGPNAVHADANCGSVFLDECRLDETRGTKGLVSSATKNNVRSGGVLTTFP